MENNQLDSPKTNLSYSTPKWAKNGHKKGLLDIKRKLDQCALRQKFKENTVQIQKTKRYNLTLDVIWKPFFILYIVIHDNL